MSEIIANAIYDVLVVAWDAGEQGRADFVQSFIINDWTEYRCGWGRFYRERERWRVGVYPEDQAGQASRIVAANRLLERLRDHLTQLAARDAEIERLNRIIDASNMRHGLEVNAALRRSTSEE